ncbi:hypothetical protein MASR1M74_28840 [Lentimicrobium sp.]
MKNLLGLFVLLHLLFPMLTKGQTIDAAKDIKTPELEIGIVEHLDEYLPESITIIDTAGKEVNLRALIDKPTVLMWVYYRCPGLCSPLMTSMAELISKTDLELGKDFQVITISFDPTEVAN